MKPAADDLDLPPTRLWVLVGCLYAGIAMVAILVTLVDKGCTITIDGVQHSLKFGTVVK